MINKGTNVCFLIPPPNGKFIIRDYAGGMGFEATYEKEMSYLLPPLDFLQLAACIRDEFNVHIIDAHAEQLELIDLIEKIKTIDCKLVIIELSIPTLNFDLECAKQLQILGIEVIGKIQSQEKDVLDKVFRPGYIKLCLIAEVEDNLINILFGTDKAGTAFIENETLIINNKKPIDNLDLLPFPARELTVRNTYFYPKLGECTTIITSRGCPFSCSYYCPYPLTQGKRWRAKSVNYVLSEISQSVNLGYRKFLFRDPIFSLQEDHVIGIARGIIDLDEEITWWCETRADRITEKMVKLMSQSGCRGINIGVESGDDKLRFSHLKKGVSDAVLMNLSSWCKKYGVHLAFLLMVGFPGEDRNSILSTAKLICKCRPGSIGIGFPVNHPGTDLDKDAKKNNWIIEDDYTLTDGSIPVLAGPTLGAAEMIIAKQLLINLFNTIQGGRSDKELAAMNLIEEWCLAN